MRRIAALALVVGCHGGHDLRLIAADLPPGIDRTGALFFDASGALVASTALVPTSEAAELGDIVDVGESIEEAWVVGYAQGVLRGELESPNLVLRLEGRAQLPTPSYFGRGFRDQRMVRVHRTPLRRPIAVEANADRCPHFASRPIVYDEDIVGVVPEGPTALVVTTSSVGPSFWRVGPGGQNESVDSEVRGLDAFTSLRIEAAARLPDGRIWLGSAKGDVFAGRLETGFTRLPSPLPDRSRPVYAITSSSADGRFTYAILEDGSSHRYDADRGQWRMMTPSQGSCAFAVCGGVFVDGALYVSSYRAAGNKIAIMRVKAGVATEEIVFAHPDLSEYPGAMGVTPRGLMVALVVIGRMRFFVRDPKSGDWKPAEGIESIPNQAPRLIISTPDGMSFSAGDYGNLRYLDDLSCESELVAIPQLGTVAPIERGFVFGPSKWSRYTIAGPSGEEKPHDVRTLSVTTLE